MPIATARDRGHTFGEAYMLMHYGCKACGHMEIIWNSRDGVTPFGCSCPKCKGIMNHVYWKKDVYAPNHKLEDGQGCWRDGTPEEAEAYMKQRIELMRDKYPCSPEEEAHLLKVARDESEEGEFQKGWPMLHRAT